MKESIMQKDGVENFFRSLGTVAIRWRMLLIAAVMFLTLVLGAGLGRMHLDISNESWFLPDSPMVIATEKFKDIFGNDDYIAILVEAEDIFDPEVLGTIRDLGHELVRKVPYGGQLTSITDIEFIRGTADGMVIEQVVPQKIPTDAAGIEAIRTKAFSKNFFVNRIISDDSRQAWILMRMKRYPETRDGIEHDIKAAAMVEEILSQNRYQSEKYSLKSTGMPVANYDKRNYLSKESARTMGLAFMISIVVLGIALRTLRGIAVPMISAICSIVWVYGAMGHLGIVMDPFVMTMPVYLGLAVSIGYSIHLFNFFHRRYDSGTSRHTAITEALASAGWPIFFTALTTIGSMLSFCLVSVRPVRWVGIMTAAGVTIIYLLVMTMTPALLSFGREYSKKNTAQSHTQSTDLFFTNFANWIMRHNTQILLCFGMIVIVLLFGAAQLEIDMDWRRSSGIKVPYLARADYIAKSKIGSLYSYDLTINFNKEGRAKDPQVLKNFDLLADEITQQPMIKRVSSLLDILKDINQVMHDNDPTFYQVPETGTMVSQLLFLYEMSGGENAEIWVDYEYSTLRMSVEISDYRAAEVEHQMAFIRKRAKELFPEARTEMVGTLAQFSVMVNHVAHGELLSFMIALGVIGILMMIIFKSVRIGLIGMIPNLFPAIVVAGIMGYADIPMDIVTMTIIPMLLGVAVDDTIHFIAHARKVMNTSGYAEGIRITFKTVGRAILMTSLILVTSFSVYLTSAHLTYFHLGILIIAGIGSALLADYFISPILLRWNSLKSVVANK